MKRFEIINMLIEKHGYTSYLEIGINVVAKCFNLIECENKIGVDPVIIGEIRDGKIFKETSDEFFAHNEDTFDIVFVDGMHDEAFVTRDINNALKFLNEGGTIIVHDCNPLTEKAAAKWEDHDMKGIWNGDVYKGWLNLRRRSDICMAVIDADHGCGIIQKGNQEPFSLDTEYSFKEFRANHVEWLNLISTKEFKERYV